MEELARHDITSEPSNVYHLEDLDLVCWEFDGTFENMGAKFQPGRVLLRTLSSEPDGDQTMTIWAILHITAIGDIRWSQKQP